MADRSVIVKLVADNTSFDAAMLGSGKKVAEIGSKATVAGDVASSAMSKIRNAAISVLGVGLLKSGQDMINLRQQAQIAFTSMTGDAEKANAQIQKIYEWDQKNPIPFQNALAAGQKLAAFGIDLDKIVPTLASIADATGAVGGTADTFDRIALALGQIQTKGKLSAQEMLQLSEAGLPAWQLLAEQIGVTVPEAMKLAEKNAIDADTAISALSAGIEQRFGGAAENMKSTTAGAFQSLAAGIRNAAESILTPLQETEKQAALTGKALIEMVGTGVGGIVQSGVTALSAPFRLFVSDAKDGADAAKQQKSALEELAPTLSVTAIAMLATHAGSTRLEAAGVSLGARLNGLVGSAQSLGQTWVMAGAETENFRQRMSLTWQTANAGRPALTSLGGAVKGLMGFFGGPLGVAIIGATTVMSLWGQAQTEAKQKEAEHQTQLNELKDTFDRVSGSVTQATKTKLIDQWTDSDDLASIKAAGINIGLATDAATNGGAALTTFQQLVHNNVLGIIQQSTAYQDLAAKGVDADAAAGKIADTIARGNDVYALGSDSLTQLMEGQGSALNNYVESARVVNQENRDLADRSTEIRSRFLDQAEAVAHTAGVTKDQLVTALDDAYTSGGHVEDALASIGLHGDAASDAISGLSGYVIQGAGDFHVMSGAALDAGAAMSAAGDGAADGADKIVASTGRAVSAMQAQLQAALSLRQSISGALTGFVDPMGAWDAAVQAANPTRSGGGGGRKAASGKSPAVLAAEAAVKAGKIQADGTKKSAKAEQDAAVKAAAAIRDGIKKQADADLKATKAAEKNAQDRVSAVKKEADELKRIADDAEKRASDAQDRLGAAEFAKRAADLALQQAQAGLATADTPEKRASWERAVANAMADQATAAGNLASAQQDAAQATQDVTKSKRDSEDATKRQSDAEAAYQSAQDKTAQVTETTSARKSAADDAYTKAKEKADTRYQKSVDAVNSKLDALTKAQDAARDSAQKMATGASGAVGGMVKKIEPSLDQYLGQLRKQVDAQQTWFDNITSLTSRLGPQVAAGLINLGPSAAPLVQELVNGTDKQLQEFATLFPKSTDTGVQGMVNGLIAGIAPVSLRAAGLSTAAITSLMNELSSAKTQSEAQTAMSKILWAMQTQANKSPVKMDLGINTDKADSWLRAWMQKKTSEVGSTFGSMAIGNIKVKGGQYASGGMVSDGWFTVGEQGPELGYKQGSQTRIFSNPQSQQMIPAPAPSGPQITIVQNNVINYPQGTPPAVATNRELASAAALGGLG